MNYTDRMAHLITQRAYARDVARRGLSALLQPYTARPAVIPSQRRRVVRSEVSA